MNRGERSGHAPSKRAGAALGATRPSGRLETRPVIAVTARIPIEGSTSLLASARAQPAPSRRSPPENGAGPWRVRVPALSIRALRCASSVNPDGSAAGMAAELGAALARSAVAAGCPPCGAVPAAFRPSEVGLGEGSGG